MLLRLASVSLVLSVAPVAAETWFPLAEEEASTFAGDWVGTCQIAQPYGCEAVTTTAYSAEGGAARVTLSWALWGDDGYAFQFFATHAPERITGDQTITVGAITLTLAEGADYFALTGEYGPIKRAIEIGEPLIVEQLREVMASGDTLVWDWGDGQQTIPIAGFSEVFGAVAKYRKELVK